ncbi:ATP-binding protein [Peptoclostridium litorale]|nr:transporter substrate-binding domain-containing protein [Peptoclostridium litorale]
MAMVIASSQNVAFGEHAKKDQGAIEFTDKELEWIREHKESKIRIGVAQDYVPVEYIDSNGIQRGLGSGMLKKISEETGLEFELYYNNENETWEEILQSMWAGRIDLLPLVSYTEERSRYLQFSKPYTEFTQVVVSRKEKKCFISDLSRLTEGVFAVPRGYWFLDLIKSQNPAIDIVEVKSMKEALEYVSKGRADYTICEIPVYTYYKEQGIYDGIRIVGEFKEKNKAAMATSKEFEGMIPIINKVIENLNYDEIYENALVFPVDSTSGARLRMTVIFLSMALLATFYFLYHTFEKLVNAKQQAEEASDEKSKFMSGIAHDLRTPIAIIMGYSEMINGKKAKTQSDIERYISKIYEKAEGLSSLIEEIFMASRLEDNRFEFQMEDTSINELVSDVAEDLGFKAAEKGIEIQVKLVEGADAVRKVDRVEFRRAIENIVTNAIKYSEEGDVIQIRTIKRSDGRILIHVKDEGLGISEIDIGHIFERYYRGENRNSESVGLGLYITKEIIQRHGGDIWVESKCGIGSIFYVAI